MTLKLFTSQLLKSLQGGNRYINLGRNIFYSVGNIDDRTYLFLDKFDII